MHIASPLCICENKMQIWNTRFPNYKALIKVVLYSQTSLLSIKNKRYSTSTWHPSYHLQKSKIERIWTRAQKNHDTQCFADTMPLRHRANNVWQNVKKHPVCGFRVNTPAYPLQSWSGHLYSPRPLHSEKKTSNSISNIQFWRGVIRTQFGC